MEYLDIINESDEVVGREERFVIHQKGLLHREIHLWFFDKEKNIIFQKRGKEKSSGGLLDATVGGHVDEGESYSEAALREGIEETGIPIKKEELVVLEKLHERALVDRGSKINNFIRNIYLYTKPISAHDLKREEDVLGVDFLTFSIEELIKTDQEDPRFEQFILKEEIPHVIKYLTGVNE